MSLLLPSLKCVSNCCTSGSSYTGVHSFLQRLQHYMFPHLKILNVYTVFQAIVTPCCLLLSPVLPAKLLLLPDPTQLHVYVCACVRLCVCVSLSLIREACMSMGGVTYHGMASLPYP